MRKTLILLGLLLAVLFAILLAGRLLRKQVYLQVDEQPAVQYATYAGSVGQALSALNVALGASDWVSPTLDAPVQNGDLILIRRAEAVQIEADGQIYAIYSTEEVPAVWLEQAGLSLQPGDRLWAGGMEIAAQEPTAARSIQLQRLKSFTLEQNGVEREVHSYASTFGQALWEAGVRLRAGDRLEPAADTPLREGLVARLESARMLNVQTLNGVQQIWSAAGTVGQALAENDLAPQGLDYTLPAGNLPLPADGWVRLVRASEEMQLTQTLLPFETTYQPASGVELDSRSVITAGLYGIEVLPVRVYYEDGVEISRSSEAGYLARSPRNQVVGFGTDIVLRTLETPSGSVQYYRAVQVYATSYSPCRSGGSRCYPNTSSGKPVTRGVIAVRYSWYLAMAGQPVYIPGYGFATIEDVGGGIPGRHWIDLGFSDDEYIPMTGWMTLYFLAPAPANPLWILP